MNEWIRMLVANGLNFAPDWLIQEPCLTNSVVALRSKSLSQSIRKAIFQVNIDWPVVSILSSQSLVGQPPLDSCGLAVARTEAPLVGAFTIRGTARSTQPCIPLGSLNRGLALIGWGKGWNVTSAGWQVTLCDPIWHMSSRSGAMLVAQTAICFFTFTSKIWRWESFCLQ